MWCDTCEQWYHISCCDARQEVKSQEEAERTVIRGARFGITGTASFIDNEDKAVKDVLQRGKFLKYSCPTCQVSLL